MCQTLNAVALMVEGPPLAGCSTPRATDGEKASGLSIARRKAGRPEDTLPSQAALAGWATPTAHEKARSEEFRKGRELNAREALVGWATPTSRDHKDGECEKADVPTNGLLGRQAVRLPAEGSGPPSISSPVKTRSRGALSPEHSRWLIGFPAGWGDYAVTATR